jgi:membrane-bound lytic murein transglycosylase D
VNTPTPEPKTSFLQVQAATDIASFSDDDDAGPQQHQTSVTTAATTNSAISADLLSAPDLWGRMRRGFSMPPLNNNGLVKAHMKRFSSTGFLQARSDRIRLYMALIIEELEQRKLPLELALLPMVESALNPQARSPVGALGVWQFMAPTARNYQLRTSHLVDDRKNLRQATRAAMTYLEKLYAQFGDWHLAMAAYNWGEGRVSQAVSSQNARGLPTDFNALASRMPAETRNYVPQIMALAEIVANPSASGVRLPEMPDGNPLVEVALNRDIDLSLAVRMAGVSEREFLALNPAVKPPLILAAGTPELLLPEDAASRLETALGAHSGKTATWMVRKISQTQHVEAIALDFGTTANALRAANGIPRGMKPVAGSTLLLPIDAPAGSSASEHLVADASLQTTRDIVKVFTQVRPRESLVDVARRTAVSIAELAHWNGIATKRTKRPLGIGKLLTLWVPRERATSFLGKVPVSNSSAGRMNRH